MGDDTPQNGPPTQGDTLEQMDPITGKHKDYIVNDFQIDLPYDHSYLVENLIDPAHIPISHDATSGASGEFSETKKIARFTALFVALLLDYKVEDYFFVRRNNIQPDKGCSRGSVSSPSLLCGAR